MPAQELLTKANGVFHSYIKRAILHQNLRTVAPFTFRTVQKVSKTIASFSTESLDAVRVLLPRALTVIAMEKPSNVVYSRFHATLDEATGAFFR
jgi:hypothetical protein